MTLTSKLAASNGQQQAADGDKWPAVASGATSRQEVLLGLSEKPPPPPSPALRETYEMGRQSPVGGQRAKTQAGAWWSRLGKRWTGSERANYRDYDRHQELSESDRFEELFGSQDSSDDASVGEKKQKQQEESRRKGGRWSTMAKVGLVIVLIDLLIYYWPMEAPEIEPKVAAARPRPAFKGPLALNEKLDEAELLFAGQFHAPESMAWQTDKRAFYTGVEGGFVLFVEPYERRWSVVAKLNARDSVLDETPPTSIQEQKNDTKTSRFVPYCTSDVELYGREAEFEPKFVVMSRCSRPLGIRLSPDNSHLYASDPLSGLYRVDLLTRQAPESQPVSHQVTKLLDFSEFQRQSWTPPTSSPEADSSAGSAERVLFADDIAVAWGAGARSSDLIYLTDCSQRWTLRYLFRMILENDDSGRVLQFDTGERRLTVMGSITPVSSFQASASGNGSETSVDTRNLSFPNGVELTSNGSALLISDLNNRRILMHHLRGPLQGSTQLLMWAPGYSDNIRRGLDLADGRATYWAACGCAVSDGRFEVAEFFNDYPRARKIFMKNMHFVGSAIEQLGALVGSTRLQDAGLMIRAAWLKVDPYCTHGLVFQFTEQGEMLRALHAPQFMSHFKLISEAHEVPLLQQQQNNSSSGTKSSLYLGSVYYSYLGRLDLDPLSADDKAGQPSTPSVAAEAATV